MGIIGHDLLPKQRSRKNGLQADIDLFPYAQELYDELDTIGIIDRVKSVPQLGVIKVPKKLSKTRYDYFMLQLYLHQVVRVNLRDKLKISYGNLVNSKEFRDDYRYNSKNDKPSIGDVLQLLTIVYNIGHFYNTFTASRALTMIASEDITFKNLLFNASSDQRYKDAVNKMLTQKDYQHFHLINSILILEKCDKSKQAVSLSLEVLYAYINQEQLTTDDKLTYIFDVFRIVRNVSYMAYDLQIANTPFTIDICNESAMKVIFQELLSEYNDNHSSNQLVDSIGKLLDDTVYNESSNAICYYKISRRMVNLLAKKDSFAEMDYYLDFFINQGSIFNENYSHKRDFVQEQILKLTFSAQDRQLSEYLLADLESINNTRVGYYDRHTGEKTILVSIRKNCDYNSKVLAAFKTLKCAISYLRRIAGVTPYDVRYLLCAKFFLFYFTNENPVVIKPTIDRERCVACTRGKNARIRELSALVRGSVGNEDETHEAQFLLDCLKIDNVNDTSICIPASILVYNKNTIGKVLCEFDGMIIHPMRKQNQILFLEAKNTRYKPDYGKNCLIEKLNKLSIIYDANEIQTVGHDAVLRYTF